MTPKQEIVLRLLEARLKGGREMDSLALQYYAEIADKILAGSYQAAHVEPLKDLLRGL